MIKQKACFYINDKIASILHKTPQKLESKLLGYSSLVRLPLQINQKRYAPILKQGAQIDRHCGSPNPCHDCLC